MIKDSSAQQHKLRTQFYIWIGGLIGVFAITLGIIISFVFSLKQDMLQIFNEEIRTSRLASEVAVLTLLNRRYEKDLFLSIDDPPQVQSYLESWEAAHTDLLATIDAFGAVQPANADQADLWRTITESYGVNVRGIVDLIEAGSITSPVQANVALEPFKDPIRELTDSSQAVAAEKNAQAFAAEAALEDRMWQIFWIIALLSGIVVTGATVVTVVFPTRLLHPIMLLRTATDRFADGDLSVRAPIQRQDEVGDLAASFNHMTEVLEEYTHRLEAQREAAEAARIEAEQSRATIAEKLAIIEDQRAVLREMSVPLLPLSQSALVMPLIGALDSTRMALAQERALTELQGQRIRHLLLDVTGVPVIDTQVAGGLIKLINAARLLGSDVAMVGIKPDVAQTLVHLGVDLEDIKVYRSMQEGIEAVLRN